MFKNWGIHWTPNTWTEHLLVRRTFKRWWIQPYLSIMLLIYPQLFIKYSLYKKSWIRLILIWIFIEISIKTLLLLWSFWPCYLFKSVHKPFISNSFPIIWKYPIMLRLLIMTFISIDTPVNKINICLPEKLKHQQPKLMMSINFTEFPQKKRNSQISHKQLLVIQFLFKLFIGTVFPVKKWPRTFIQMPTIN